MPASASALAAAAAERGVADLPAEGSAPRTRGMLRDVLQTVLLMAALFVGLRGIVQNFRVEGPSMQPTLATGQFLWVNKAAYFRVGDAFALGGPSRGDVAVLVPPGDQPDFDLIKRVIGLPGEEVLVDGGRVLVDGRPLDEPYVRFVPNYTYPPDGRPLRIPAGQYFVLGDNRANSRDSHLGWLVPAENLVGRAWLTYWPPSAWGLLPGPSYAG